MEEPARGVAPLDSRFKDGTMELMYPGDRALLMVGETYYTADLYYATRYLFPDPVIYIDKGDGDSLIACGDFEREGAATHSKAVRVRGFQDYGAAELPDELHPHQRLAELALRALRDEGVACAVTTDSIPLSVADHLRAHGIDLLCQPELLRNTRERKDPRELSAIEAAQHATAEAMGLAIELIGGATVGEDDILYTGVLPLTSERLRAAIDASLQERGCGGEGTITASGLDSAQPHNHGHGTIRAGQPVVIDIFPRHKTLRYYADMTRTVCKGAPSAEIARMYDATHDALQYALGLLRPGATGQTVFEEVCRFYEGRGYPTYLREGKFPAEGFVHSLGHGVGLEVHEGPGLGRRPDQLEEGQVITVEPGLYMPGLGGVRIEDMVVLTADGCRNLTNYPAELVV